MCRNSLVAVVSVAVAVGSSLSVAPRARADLMLLNDGTSLVGDVKKAGDGYDVTDRFGKATHVVADAVKSIQMTPRGAGGVGGGAEGALAGAEKLASLRRSVEAFGDPKVIVDRYEKFIEANKSAGGSAIEDARKDLAVWRDRVEKGMVKVAGKWVSLEERAALQERSLLTIDQARELLKQNKLREADAAVAKALEVDPTNASALYLRGLVAFRQDNIPVARKAFESVKEAMPDYGPALNNLAVILWRQNQRIAAMNTYHQAMQAMPLNKELLNNVAEALNALTDEQRKSPVVQKVQKLWSEQDVQLQQQLMAVGWYRWGATWVDKATFSKLEAAEKVVKDKLTKMEDDFADAQAKVTSIDAQIDQNNLAMRAMENSRVAYDATGKSIIYPLPPQYFEYDRANRRLEVQRGETLKLIEALRAKAQVVKAQLPMPKFNNVQLVIGTEGTPAIAPADRPKAAAGSATADAGAAEKPAVAAEPVKPGTPEVAAKPDTPKVDGPANLLDELGGDSSKKPEAPKDGGGEKPLKY